MRAGRELKPDFPALTSRGRRGPLKRSEGATPQRGRTTRGSPASPRGGAPHHREPFAVPLGGRDRVPPTPLGAPWAWPPRPDNESGLPEPGPHRAGALRDRRHPARVRVRRRADRFRCPAPGRSWADFRAAVGARQADPDSGARVGLDLEAGTLLRRHVGWVWAPPPP